jgi:hypothetical protein
MSSSPPGHVGSDLDRDADIPERVSSDPLPSARSSTSPSTESSPRTTSTRRSRAGTAVDRVPVDNQLHYGLDIGGSLAKIVVFRPSAIPQEHELEHVQLLRSRTHEIEYVRFSVSVSVSVSFYFVRSFISLTLF